MTPNSIGTSPTRGSRTNDPARSGSSGASVRIVERADGSRVAVKIAVSPRVSAPHQAAGREQIVPFFGDRLPRVLYAGRCAGRDILICECPTPDTLAETASEHGPTPDLLATWADIVNELVAVWQQSARPGYEPENAPRSHPRRLQRAADGLADAFATFSVDLSGQHRFIVNGADLGTWDQLRRRLAALPPPRFRVACLGDPQPANILLTAQRLPADQLESAVLASLVQTYQRSDLFDQATAAVAERRDALHAQHTEELTAVQRELASAEPAIERYLRAFETDTMPESVCGPRVKELTETTAQLRDHESDLTQLCTSNDVAPVRRNWPPCAPPSTRPSPTTAQPPPRTRSRT